MKKITAILVKFRFLLIACAIVFFIENLIMYFIFNPAAGLDLIVQTVISLPLTAIGFLAPFLTVKLLRRSAPETADTVGFVGLTISFILSVAMAMTVAAQGFLLYGFILPAVLLAFVTSFLFGKD